LTPTIATAQTKDAVQRNQEEQTMNLIEAASRGDLEAVEQIVAQGADIHGRDSRGRTALIAAAYGNRLAVAEWLIKAGADVNEQDETKQSAYLIATSEGYLELLKLTLAAGADVHRTDSYNGTGLIRAADRGHVEIIQELLKTDIDVNHVNRLGWTALLEAIILGDGGPRHTEVVRLLVEAGADVNLADSSRVTPLAHAQQRVYDEIGAILRRAGARHAQNAGESIVDEALIQAVKSRDYPYLDKAVRSGQTLDVIGSDGKSALLTATARRDTTMVQWLLEHGADVDFYDPTYDIIDKTAFLYASAHGFNDFLEILIPYTPNVSIRNGYGGNGLIPAAEKGHVDTVKLLLEKTDVDVNFVNYLSWTALLEVAIFGEDNQTYREIVRLLLQHGADPGIPDKDGVTAQDHARRRSLTQILQLMQTNTGSN
jgi:ankyrin repeat protein